MIRAIYYFVFIKLMGWKIEGNVPRVNKFLIVVAPHTSNWDFVIGVFTRSILRFKSNYVAKKELFIFPFGVFFRRMGGHPVDRSGGKNFVDAIVELYQTEKRFALALTPEGTRKRNDNWRTGFYYIATKANIPVVRCGLDYENKRVVFDAPHHITESKEDCVRNYKRYFSQFKGRNPQTGVLWEE